MWRKPSFAEPPCLHFMLTPEGTYQAKQCRLVKSCVTICPPSLPEERVSTATFMSSLNRTHTSTFRRMPDHHHGEKTCPQEAVALNWS